MQPRLPLGPRPGSLQPGGTGSPYPCTGTLLTTIYLCLPQACRRTPPGLSKPTFWDKLAFRQDFCYPGACEKNCHREKGCWEVFPQTEGLKKSFFDRGVQDCAIIPKEMKNNFYLALFSTIAALCFIAMLAVTVIWMYVPIRIIYQESSLVKTESSTIAVRQHGKAYFVTPGQKQVLDLIQGYTPVIWFSCFGYLFLFTVFGGFERLRLLRRHHEEK